MIWTIEYGGDPQDVTVTTAGVATPREFCAMCADVAWDPRWRTGSTVLADHSALDVSGLNGGDVGAVANFIVGLDDHFRHSLWAVVVSDAYVEGLLAVLIGYLEPTELRARSFQSRDAAVEWLAAARVSGSVA
jgi:hypothetical protein